MGKYRLLREFLENIDVNITECILTFDEVNKIISGKLPPSAYYHRSWWSNPKSKNYHPHARSWLMAGFGVSHVDFEKKMVTFRRIGIDKSNVLMRNPCDEIISRGRSDNKENQNRAEIEPSEALQFLKSIGFEKVGYWYLEGNKLKCKLEKYKNEKNLIYAFVAEDHIKYIGKTEKTLYSRIYGYARPGPTQNTNIKNSKKIINLLEKNVPVTIFVLLPRENVLYKDSLQIDLAAGLEGPLISKLKPPWNGSCKEGI